MASEFSSEPQTINSNLFDGDTAVTFFLTAVSLLILLGLILSDGPLILFPLTFFPVFAGIFLYISGKRWLEYFRIGKSKLNLDPYPGALGGDIAGTIDFSFPYRSEDVSTVTLQCVQLYKKNGTVNHTPTKIWQTHAEITGAAAGQGTRITFKFAAPADLPETQPKQMDHGTYHKWQIAITGNSSKGKINRKFDIPVYRSDAVANGINEYSDENYATQTKNRAQVSRKLEIREAKEGVEIINAYDRSQLRTGRDVSLGTIIFLFGVGAGFLVESILAASLPVLFGIFVVCYSIVHRGSVIKVRFSSGLIARERRVLGVQVSHEMIEMKNLRDIGVSNKSLIPQAQEGRQANFSVYASDGVKDLVLAEGFLGESEAREAVELITEKVRDYLPSS